MKKKKKRSNLLKGRLIRERITEKAVGGSIYRGTIYLI